MKIKGLNKSKHELPGFSTVSSAGMDIRANIGNEIVIKPIARTLDNYRTFCGDSGRL